VSEWTERKDRRLAEARAAERAQVLEELRVVRAGDRQATYDRFWRPLVEINGVMVPELVRRELHDYAWLLDQVPKVYAHVTGGKLSKPHYTANAVCTQADEHYEQGYGEAAAEAVLAERQVLAPVLRALVRSAADGAPVDFGGGSVPEWVQALIAEEFRPTTGDVAAALDAVGDPVGADVVRAEAAG
jgi:hypothetical protein